MNPRTSRLGAPLAVGVVFILLILGLLIIWRGGAFTFTGSDPSSKIVAAGLGLAGILLTAFVSLVGLILNQSLDSRAELRLRAESERNEVLERESNSRMKLEASIRAVELLSTPSGTVAPPVKCAGAVLALSSLGQHELAVGITAELSAASLVAPAVVALVMDRALTDGSDDVRMEVVHVLSRHPERMITPDGFSFPNCVLNGCENQSTYVRRWAVYGLAGVLLSRPLAEWREHFMASVGAIAAALVLIWQSTEISDAKENTGAIIREMLEAFPEATAGNHPRSRVDFEAIRGAVANASASTNVAVDVVLRLQAWRRTS